MQFDPEKRRRLLSDSVIAIFMEVSYEDAFHAQTMGITGSPTLAVTIQSYLVGLFDDAKKLLDKAHTLLRISTERKEYERADRPALFDDFATCQWLHNGANEKRLLNQQVDSHEQHFAAEHTEPNQLDVQRALPVYLEAERYDTLIARYESAGLKRPKDIHHILDEGAMCYVLARHRLGLEYTDEEIAAALETFLKRSAKEWLGQYGTFCTAARWMKIAHWKQDDDPIATLLRCYDYLPGLIPPNYLPQIKRRPQFKPAG